MSDFEYNTEQDLVKPPSFNDLSRIVSYNISNSVDVLRQRIEQNEIDLSPEFQRDFVWDINRASLFVDSLLIGLPIPSIFLGKTRENESYLVIDGQQRLKTIYFFMLGKFLNKGQWRQFSLKHLDGRPWNDKTYEELDETYKRRFRNAVLNTTIVEDIDLNPSVIHDLFHRLNTGGMPLKEQEIRQCIYAGPFSKFLNELNYYPNWRKLEGKEFVDIRLSDVEMVLRFFALLFNLENYSPSMRDFLSSFMSDKKNDLNIMEYYRNIFEKTVDLILIEIGENAFRNGKVINKSICDSIMVSLASLLINGNIPENVLSNFINLRKDIQYGLFIRQGTTSEANVKGRIALAKKYFSGECHDNF